MLTRKYEPKGYRPIMVLWWFVGVGVGTTKICYHFCQSDNGMILSAKNSCSGKTKKKYKPLVHFARLQ